MAESGDPYIRAVEITCSLIETLRVGGKMGVSEIAAKMGYAKSTIYNHLVTLEKNHLVVSEDSKYRLSLHFLEIASDIKSQHGLLHYSIIRRKVNELSAETGENARFGNEEHGELINIYQVQRSPGVSEHFQLSMREPMHCTATGKSMLAFMSQERVDEIINVRGLEQKTENTITDYDELMKELENIRKQRFAIDDEERATGLRCIAAPVIENRRYRAVIIGSIGIFGPVSRLSGDKLDEITTQIQQFANMIEIACNAGK